MYLSKPKIYGKGGIELTIWDFGENPLLDGPGAIPQRDAVLTAVSETLRFVLTNNSTLWVIWGDDADLEIMLCLGDVDDGLVEWTLSLTQLLEAIADDIADGQMDRKKQLEVADALRVTAERILAGEYAPLKGRGERHE
jgi:hypothetical protein